MYNLGPSFIPHTTGFPRILAGAGAWTMQEELQGDHHMTQPCRAGCTETISNNATVQAFLGENKGNSDEIFMRVGHISEKPCGKAMPGLGLAG